MMTFRFIGIFVLIAVFVVLGTGQTETPPPTIWNAGSRTFTQPTTGNQDCITAQTCLRRSTVLYNSVAETVGGHQPCPGYQGPANTEWAWGHITEWDTLVYKKLFDLNTCFPPGMNDRPMVLHLISENIYLQVRFIFWNSGSSGFSYVRTTAPAAATATISGRVLGPDGRGVRKADVILTDQNSVPRTVHADGLGRYTIPNVPTGVTYTIGVTTRRFTFTARPITVNGNLAGQDLVCQIR